MNIPTIVSMKDIRLSLAAIARRVEAGERFIVVRDSKPVFQIEPLTDTKQGPKREMTFREFTEKVDRVRDSAGAEWTPEAVEEVIQEMYHERSKDGPAAGSGKVSFPKRRGRRS